MTSEKHSATHVATTTEQLLGRVGVWNPYTQYISVSMAILWIFSAMPTMSPAFMSPVSRCKKNCTFVTIQDEFNLKRMLIDPSELTSSIYFFGNCVLGQIYCIAADRIGRRPVLVWSLIVSGLSGTLAAVAPTFSLMLAGRFIQGSFFSAITMVNWVMCCESIAFSGHGVASMLFGICWVIGYCVILPIANVFPNWRYVQMMTSFPALIFGVIMLLTLPESVSFLITKRRRSDVARWVSKASYFGRKNILYDMDKLIANESKESENATLCETLGHIVHKKKLMVNVVIQIIIWFVDFMLYSAMSLTSTAIGGGDSHLSFLFSGLVELPCYFILPFSLDLLGRKPSVIISHLLTTISFMSMLFIDGDNSPQIFMIMWLIGKFGVATSFMCCFVYGSEIFPVEYRNICLGICATLANVGAMMSTHLTILDTIRPGLMYTTFTFLCLLCIALIPFLPETKHHHTHKDSTSSTDTVVRF